MTDTGAPPCTCTLHHDDPHEEEGCPAHDPAAPSNAAIADALLSVLVQTDEPSEETRSLCEDEHDEAVVADFLATLRAAVLQRASDWAADRGRPDPT